MGRELPSNWGTRRRKICQRDQRQCQNCGRYRGMRGLTLNIHHIQPRKRGGTHKPRNLVTVCNRCHNQIHHGDINNPSHDNPLDAAIEAVRSIGWQVSERIQRRDLLDVVRNHKVPSMDSLQAHLSSVRRAEQVGFSPKSFGDIVRDLNTHSKTSSSDCNHIS